MFSNFVLKIINLSLSINNVSSQMWTGRWWDSFGKKVPYKSEGISRTTPSYRFLQYSRPQTYLSNFIKQNPDLYKKDFISTKKDKQDSMPLSYMEQFEGVQPTVEEEVIISDKQQQNDCYSHFNLDQINAFIKQIETSIVEMEAGNKEKLSLSLKLASDAADEKINQFKNLLDYYNNMKLELEQKKPTDPNFIIKKVPYMPVFNGNSLPLQHHFYLMNEKVKDIQEQELDQFDHLDDATLVPGSEVLKQYDDPDLLNSFNQVANKKTIAMPTGLSLGGDNHDSEGGSDNKDVGFGAFD